MNLKFKRQVLVAGYIADFLCRSPRLIIELDGGQHTERAAHDLRRDRRLRAQGFEVLRFWNHEVLNETGAVLEAIRYKALSLAPVSGRTPEA